MTLERTLQIAKQLIAFDSVSSRSNVPVSDWIEAFLREQGFAIEKLSYRDHHGELKANLIAKRLPATLAGDEAGSGVCYIAHNDVVPADDWNLDFCGPFTPVVRDQRLYGRGSCDMKGSLACALSAVAAILPTEQKYPLYLIVTADEEINMLGAKHVAQHSRWFAEMVAAGTPGIIGEPTRLAVVHAHKGGQSFWISARGRSAHSSSSDGINANLALIPILPFLLELQRQTEADGSLQNPVFDPPTLSWNLILRNEPYAANITPSLAEASVFLRLMPGVDHSPLLARVRKKALELGLEYRENEASPPLDVPVDAEAVATMLQLTGEPAATTVCYATDGSALRQLASLVVCGPGSIEQAHRCDEWIALEQLERGTELYTRAFRHWTCG
jgi:acetylornithine deacetylase